MFYFISKLFWFLAEPSNLVGFILLLTTLGLATRYAGAARKLLAATTLVYLLAAFGPLEPILMRPLEDRFPRPPADMPAPDGVIVLGGGMDEYAIESRGALVLNAGGSRMTEGAMLARRFPQAKLIFTGGSGAIRQQAITEAEAARRLFLALGVPPEQLVLEDQSRNTYENAILTREIVKPRPEQRFLLVTSGFHIPRAMGVFRRAGFNVIAWPADYATSGTPADYWHFNTAASGNLMFLDLAAKEWVGLIAYRLAGMTDALLPAP